MARLNGSLFNFLTTAKLFSHQQDLIVPVLLHPHKHLVWSVFLSLAILIGM